MSSSCSRPALPFRSEGLRPRLSTRRLTLLHRATSSRTREIRVPIFQSSIRFDLSRLSRRVRGAVRPTKVGPPTFRSVRRLRPGRLFRTVRPDTSVRTRPELSTSSAPRRAPRAWPLDLRGRAGDSLVVVVLAFVAQEEDNLAAADRVRDHVARSPAIQSQLLADSSSRDRPLQGPGGWASKPLSAPGVRDQRAPHSWTQTVRPLVRRLRYVRPARGLSLQEL